MNFLDIEDVLGGALVLAAIYGLVRLVMRLTGGGPIFPQV